MTKFCYALLLFLFLQGCNSTQKQDNPQERTAASSADFEKTAIRHAKGFQIQYFDDYKLVSILNPFGHAGDTLRYVLQRKGAVPPTQIANAPRIEIPVKGLVAMSSMHVGLLEMLDAQDVLTGLGSLQYVYSPAVLERIKAGKVVEVGRDQGLNDEKVIEMHPDLVMTIGSPGGKMDHYRLLRDAGIPVLINSEWVEHTPLGRAEWVKLAAALLDKEALVNEKFEKIETEYNRLAALASKTASKPTVLSGLNTKDAWFLPSGDSYMAQFFADAGADYPWKNQKATGSLPIAFEAVYPIALKAGFWLNVGFDAGDTRQSILSQDARYADFNAFKTGKMYSYNARVNAQGSNDFFESGTVNPHTVLADLIRIFHPELLPEHQLVYYKQLAP